MNKTTHKNSPERIEDAYHKMVVDKEREKEAVEWVEGLVGDCLK